MPNKFYKFVHLQLFIVRYKFVHLQLFNVKYKFVYLQLFDTKFLFSKNHIFCRQKGTSAPLVSDFKLTREIDELLSPRHKYIFEVAHAVHEYTKMQIYDKRYQTNTVRTFWVTWNTSALRYLWGTKICGIQVKLWNKKF